MSMSMQVLYPVSEGSTFDFDYYANVHMALVQEHFGPHMRSAQAVRGVAGGPGKPAGYHAVATIVFSDKEAFDAAMANAGPVVGDIPNFTNVRPETLIGTVIA
ncbi:EthD family reductase [Shimia sp. SDUM112013]|uniref:EthD family reductase n=1 Tax=Shimia sp. SDUM112013 TaxID=3136160 RepID=UPI0032EB33CB